MRHFHHWISALACGLLGLALPHLSLAVTYFVDPANGNDLYAGNGLTKPWQHVPGSYRTDNTGFIPAAGWTKLNGGDTLRIKSGSTIVNRLLITPTWYSAGNGDRPIVIMRDTAWGSGAVTISGSGLTLGTWDALVSVQAGRIIVDGIAKSGIIMQNSPGAGLQGYGPSESNRMRGNIFRNLKLFNNVNFNFQMQACDSFIIDNVLIDGNRQNGTMSGGLHMGGERYSCTNGLVRDCESYNHGATPGTQEGYTDARIGFWLTNSQNISFINCRAHDCQGRGFDLGEVDPAAVITNNIKVINCRSTNNYAGFGCNLQDIAGTSRFYFVNCIADRNVMGFNIYEGPAAFVYNCLTAFNTWGIYVDAPKYVNRSTSVTIKNTVFYKNNRPGSSGSFDLYLYRIEGLSSFISDFNHFESGGQTDAIRYNMAAALDPYPYTDAKAPGSTARMWYRNHLQDAHSQCSIDGKFARFIDENKYRPSDGSDLLGLGAALSDIPEAGYDLDGSRRTAGSWGIGPYAGAGDAKVKPKQKRKSGRQSFLQQLIPDETRIFSVIGQCKGTHSQVHAAGQSNLQSGSPALPFAREAQELQVIVVPDSIASVSLSLR